MGCNVKDKIDITEGNIEGILEELEQEGYTWITGEKPTEYNPLKDKVSFGTPAFLIKEQDKDLTFCTGRREGCTCDWCEGWEEEK